MPFSVSICLYRQHWHGTSRLWIYKVVLKALTHVLQHRLHVEWEQTQALRDVDAAGGQALW